MTRTSLLGLPFDNVALDAAVEEVVRRATAGPSTQVSFVNADCVNIASDDPEYRAALLGSALTFADGVGMRIAGKVLGRPVVENVNGTDLFPRMCAAIGPDGPSLFLLGGLPGVAEGAGRWIADNHPHVRVVGAQHGYFAPSEEDAVIEAVAASGAAILLVGFGAPRQEKWIAKHLPRLGVQVAIAVGGLFDFYSGRIPRAPVALRRMGLEWVWRWIQEPRRLARRYVIGNPRFLLRVARVRLTEAAGPSRRSPKAD